MEIGGLGSEENSDAGVRARQRTGQMVTVSNKAFFDEPVYNYSKAFDYIWAEISVPPKYGTDWEKGLLASDLAGDRERPARGGRM